MLNNTPENFAKSQCAVIVAPAGCGKTELIADSVAYCSGRQLILTHTHAGVNSLRKRLKKKNISSKLFHLETIHSFALRYASAYPKTSRIISVQPKTTEEYKSVIVSTIKLFEKELAKKVLKASYAGVFVDEYQDCTIEQHNLILKLAENLPCRIVGDPLQAIFSFGGNKLVKWEDDIFSNFNRLDDLCEPWRWKSNGGNESLGRWLIEKARPAIDNHTSLTLSGLEKFGCYWHSKPKSYSQELQERANDFDNIFAICAPSNSNKPHSIAEKLRNRYKTIEPVTGNDLIVEATNIESNSNRQLLEVILQFAYKCLTKVRTDCEEVKNNLSRNFRTPRKLELKRIFNNIISNKEYSSILELYEFLESCAPTYKRWQFWREMKKGLKIAISEKLSITEACLKVKNKTKYHENQIPAKCISRTVLLKGLECECAAVINADELGQKDFYVAITRGGKELHIYSSAPFYPPKKCPQCSSLMILRNGQHGDFLGCDNYPDCKKTLHL
jgi:topoisomerase-like DNA binding C4 zinc finger protein/AAA domain-containing protein